MIGGSCYGENDCDRRTGLRKAHRRTKLLCVFSNEYENRGDLFEGRDIFKDEKYRELQGAYPVIFLTFAGVKANTYKGSVKILKYLLLNACDRLPQCGDHHIR